ncbi:MAG: DinB family protein [bacterium]|jgi:uncharacterized damage-inducible protein DinB|nr:DinB family protein [bacterium]
MITESFVPGLESQRAFFLKSLSCLSEGDSAFAPVPGMLSVARQVAHAAHTVDWFVKGAFSPTGLSEDWEAQAAREAAVPGLEEALAWFNAAYDRAVAAVRGHDWDEWQQPIAPGIMGGAPRTAIFSGMADHTAHHRGSLAVYARLLGKTPEMPYM